MGSVLIQTGGGSKNCLMSLVSDKNFKLTEKDLENVSDIGDYVFYNNTHLTSIDIPDGVTSIGDYAFYGCSMLNSVSIPSSVSHVGTNAFRGCPSVTTIHFGGTIDDWCSLSDTLIAHGGDHIKLYINGSLVSGAITINGNIPAYAFRGSNNTGVVTPTDETITSVNATASVVGDYAFDSCADLTDAVFLQNVSIGNHAFYKCYSLSNVNNGLAIGDVGDYAFYRCGISSITLGSNTTKIGAFAFNYCRYLTRIYIPASVTYIDDYAFADCENLEEIIFAPNSQLTHIGKFAFSYCSKLTTVVVPDSVTSIGEGAFFRCDSLANLTIPFIGGSKLATSRDATTKFNYIFNYSVPSSLHNVTVTGGNIIADAFDNCSMITQLNISGISVIEQSAFDNCSSSIFNVYSGAKYIGNANNSYYALIESADDSMVSCTIHNDCNIIADYAFYEHATLTDVTFNNNLVSIGNYAFYGCNLSSIIFTNTPSIGREAFNYCGIIQNVVIPAPAPDRIIADDAFYEYHGWESHSITKVVNLTTTADIHELLNTRGSRYYPYPLLSLTITDGESLNSYGSGTYSCIEGCYDLESLTLPDTIRFIAAFTFSSQANEHKFNYFNFVGELANFFNIEYEPDNGNYIYMGSQTNPLAITHTMHLNGVEVTDLVIPEGVTTLKRSALYGIYLNSLTLPRSLTRIEDYIFGNATISEIKFNGTMSEWSLMSKSTYWRNYYSGRQSLPTYIQCSDGFTHI